MPSEFVSDDEITRPLLEGVVGWRHGGSRGEFPDIISQQ